MYPPQTGKLQPFILFLGCSTGLVPLAEFLSLLTCPPPLLALSSGVGTACFLLPSSPFSAFLALSPSLIFYLCVSLCGWQVEYSVQGGGFTQRPMYSSPLPFFNLKICRYPFLFSILDGKPGRKYSSVFGSSISRLFLLRMLIAL